MAVDSSNAVSQSQIISSTSKTTNTKKSNTLEPFSSRNAESGSA